MQDLPMFQTPYGIAGLVLREIPYTKTAYVHIKATDEPENLVDACSDFCRAVGAQRIYAKGHPFVQKFPLHTTIVNMQCPKAQLPITEASLLPVERQTQHQWREIYLQKITCVPNAAWMSLRDMEQMLEKEEGYFVHKDGKLVGIGRVIDNEIAWLASVCNGAGKEIVCALAGRITQEYVRLCVSTDNHKAMRLYQSLGFTVTEELSSWYKIF